MTAALNIVDVTSSQPGLRHNPSSLYSPIGKCVSVCVSVRLGKCVCMAFVCVCGRACAVHVHARMGQGSLTGKANNMEFEIVAGTVIEHAPLSLGCQVGKP